jgi:hypothetical protein
MGVRASVSGGVQDELTIEPDGSLIIAYRNPLIGAMNPLQIAGRQPHRQKPEDVSAQAAKIA